MTEKFIPEEKYNLKSVKLPYLSGLPLKLFVNLLEGALKFFVIPTLFKNAGITWFRKQIVTESPRLYPIHSVDTRRGDAKSISVADWPNTGSSVSSGFQPATIFDFAEAYLNSKVTPEEVAQSILDSIKSNDRSSASLRAFIAVKREDVIKQAEESTRRLINGQPLSVLDGVPVAVKDEVDMASYPTTAGTAFLGQHIASTDSTVVAHMRSTGAILIGKTNMHEIGIGVTGLNPIHGTPCNPHNPDHHSGGSSSGSGVAVAAGFCPLAIGADGGGSIRIPSAFCGIVGLKPTFGRISEFGAVDLCWSVAHLGPMGSSVSDVVIGYAALSGPDKRDFMTIHQPSPRLDDWNSKDVHNLKIGIYWPWFRHATKDIVETCEAMLIHFEHAGAKIIDITIPDLELSRVAHLITIAGEMAQALGHTYDNHHKEHGLDVRINLALARALSTQDYIQAQRVRRRMINHLNHVFKQVDIIITPTTGITAPRMKSKALSGGESDLTSLFEIMRFAPLANLTGLPAISFPAGYNPAGLPIGMQAIGPAWHESLLLRVAYFAEQFIDRKKPAIHYSFISK
jgi:Asp-tRNA(Asn)/Glu-tRNA(Gln) amidotransferase A subunit family amidase